MAAKPSTFENLVVNPRLVIWPGDQTDVFLLGKDLKPSETFELSLSAISAMARLAVRNENSHAKPISAQLSETIQICADAGLLIDAERANELSLDSPTWAGFRFQDANAGAATATLTRSEQVQGRKMAVFDNVMPSDWVTSLERWLFQLAYRRVDSDREDVLRARHWIAPFPFSDAQIDAVPVFARLASIAQNWSDAPLKIARLNAYSTQYGDLPLPHRDLEGSEGVTLVSYGNSSWDPEAMGETVFFDDDDDAQLLVSPKPGRAVVFDSAILHRAGAPSRLCLESRYALVMKFFVER